MTNTVFYALIICGLTLLFFFLTVYKIDYIWKYGSPLLSYYVGHYVFLKNINLYLFIPGIFVALALLTGIPSFLIKGKYSIKKRLMLNSFYLILAVIVSFHLSFIGSYAFSMGEILVTEYKLSNKSLENGLVWDPKIISIKLSEAVVIPGVVVTDNDADTRIATQILSSGKRSEYFNRIVLQTVLEYYPINFRIPKASSFVLFNNNLYVRHFEGSDFQIIGPALGKLLVNNKFGTRSGKDYPIIETLGQDEYKNFRIHQINTRLRELSALIDKLNLAIEETDKELKHANGNINHYKRLAANSYAEGDAAYFRCSVAETCSYSYYPICGIYYCSSYSVRNCTPMFSQSYCSSLRDSYYSNGNSYTETANYWVGQYNELVAWYNEFIEYRDNVVAAKSSAEIAKASIPYELGMFAPDSNIKIAISSTDAGKTSEYISTLIHEYLHYDSHNLEDKRLPRFFEEGLTEYLSRLAQSAGLGSDTNLGYPLITAFIKRVAEKVPASELEEIYYSKDQEKLNQSLAQYLEPEFFEKNKYILEIMPYMPTEMALGAVNKILEKLELTKIDGKELDASTELNRYQ